MARQGAARLDDVLNLVPGPAHRRPDARASAGSTEAVRRGLAGLVAGLPGRRPARTPATRWPPPPACWGSNWRRRGLSARGRSAATRRADIGRAVRLLGLTVAGLLGLMAAGGLMLGGPSMSPFSARFLADLHRAAGCPRSHAPRWGMSSGTLGVRCRKPWDPDDAERRRRHSHAERGNEGKSWHGRKYGKAWWRSARCLFSAAVAYKQGSLVGAGFQPALRPRTGRKTESGGFGTRPLYVSYAG